MSGRSACLQLGLPCQRRKGAAGHLRYLEAGMPRMSALTVLQELKSRKRGSLHFKQMDLCCLTRDEDRCGQGYEVPQDWHAAQTLSNRSLARSKEIIRRLQGLLQKTAGSQHATHLPESKVLAQESDLANRWQMLSSMEKGPLLQAFCITWPREVRSLDASTQSS